MVHMQRSRLVSKAILVSIIALTAALFLAAAASAADWPQWRCDAARTAATTEQLPGQLRLLWVRELPPPQPVQPRDTRLCFDLTYQPVAAEGLVFVPSMVEDSVTAYDAATGAMRWRFVAGGPVRFAPCYWRGRLYFTSDDGHLYCLNARSGRLVWRRRVADQRLRGPLMIGDERLVSRWPCRTGPVLADGVIYCTAGLFPFETVCVAAFDARDGRVIWRNEKCSLVKNALFDHGLRDDTGIAPQGYLAVLGDRLVVACGRGLPAFFDRATGKMDPYSTGWGGRVGLSKGSWWVCGTGKLWFHSGEVFGLTADAADFAGPKPQFGKMTPEEFATTARVPVEQVKKWLKDGLLTAVQENGKTYVDATMPRGCTYLSYWTHAPRPNEAWVLRNRPRLTIDPADQGELGFFREPVVDGTVAYYSVPVKATRGRGQYETLPPGGWREVVAIDLTHAQWRITLHGRVDARKPLIPWRTLEFRQLWSLPVNLRVQIKAGRRLFGSRPGLVAAIDLPDGNQPARVTWQAQLDGTPEAMLAADGRLVVVTREGRMYCFGSGRAAARATAPRQWRRPAPRPVGDDWLARAAQLIEAARARKGFCLALGYGSGRLVRALAAASQLRMIVLEPDQAKLAAARRTLADEGLGGARVQLVAGDIFSVQLPPYFASLAVSEDWQAAVGNRLRGFVRRLYAALRPYGGAACLPADSAVSAKIQAAARDAGLPGLSVERHGVLTVLRRSGPLPMTADWTHEAADAGNTFAARERSVRPPFAVLWFGGSVDRVFPPWDFTHFRGPFPLVCHGRMYILVENRVNCVDAYTGRLMWSVPMPPGAKGRRNILHRPTGENVAATANAVYVNVEGTIFALRPQDGDVLLRVPVPGGGQWQQFRVWKDALVGASGGKLFCLDRHKGKVRWQRQFDEDRVSLALGAEKVFAAGWWSPARLRRGEKIPAEVTLWALDITGGKEIWSAKAGPPPGTKPSAAEAFKPLQPNIQYCPEQDIVVVTSVRKIAAAFEGKTGRKLWGSDVPGRQPPSALYDSEPPMVLPDVLLTNRRLVLDIRTGRPPVHGFSPGIKDMWAKAGQRGCNRAICNLAIITLRDADASFIDLATGRRVFFYGFRGGCTNSLIPADGLLSVPHFAHGCTCNAYPIFASVALWHYPDAPAWWPKEVSANAPGG